MKRSGARQKLLQVFSTVLTILLFGTYLVLFAPDNKPESRSHSRVQLFNTNAKVDNKALVKKCQVYLDWTHPAGSDAFSYVNYKAFESALAAYPKCRFEVILVAPQSANYYRIGNFISKHFFEKYNKRGYWVDVVAMPGSKQYFQTNFHDYPYWMDEYKLCCTYTAKHFERDLSKPKGIPLHMYFFARFASLAEFGGIYMDFTWYHQHSNPLPMHQPNQSMLYDGATILTFCGASKGAISSYLPCKTQEESHRQKYCQSSTLMMFRAQSPIPLCMLQRYKDDGGEGGSVKLSSSLAHESFTNKTSFLSCIYADIKTGGIYCIQSALQTCFTQHNIVNALSPGAGHQKNKDVSIHDSDDLPDLWREQGHDYDVLMFLNRSRSHSALWLGASSMEGTWTL